MRAARLAAPLHKTPLPEKRHGRLTRGADAMKNPYLELTTEFNQGRLRAVLSSGQAVVVYRLAVMSKDGDWILREDDEAIRHVLRVLEGRRAQYRFGAPLDLRWLAQGWSSHFEFRESGLRIRTDFVTRPARIAEQELQRMWESVAGRHPPVVGLEQLADIKKTNREKDYAVIGELARLMEDPRSRLLHSRSARDLIRLAEEQPELLSELALRRPALSAVKQGRNALEHALDEERRHLMRTNEERLARYRRASRRWESLWPTASREIDGLLLHQAHQILTARAEGVLPFDPEEAGR